MPQIRLRSPAPTVVSDAVDLPKNLPDLPDDVLKRFPSLDGWKEDSDAWWNKCYYALQETNRFVSQSVTKANSQNGDLRVSFNNFTASITTEIDAIVNEQGAQARRIVTVSAMAGVSQNIKIQNSAPVGPALNDFWVNNTDLTLPITYQWDGAAWQEVTDPITAAGVADERTARVTADGYLEGKYSLTVIAGNVVTGMNITSASGPGTNISSVIFRATDFQIYNGATGKVMFNVSGSDVQLAGTLVVSTSGKVYIGTGTYGNSNTAWYVDSTGQFSLKDKLTWDGTTLTINGGGTFSGALSAASGTFAGSLSAATGTFAGSLSAATGSFSGTVTASAGAIGGWSLSASTLSANNAILDSAGQLVLGTANDVVYLSATDGTYRLWVGNVAAGSAAFSVTKAGVMSATGGSFSGSITSTSGTIGGFTIGATDLSAGTGATAILISSAGSFVVGAGSATIAQITNTGLSVSLSGSHSLSVGNSTITMVVHAVGTTTITGTTINFIGDTNLYRNAANELKTDDDFTIGGTLSFGTHSAIGAETVTGFITMKDAAGNSRKLAVVS